MKKWSLAMSICAALMLGACGQESGESAKKEETSVQKVLDAKQFDKMFTNTKDYIGYDVTFPAVVFDASEKDEDFLYLQVFADPENYEKSTVVLYPDPNFKVNSDDYIQITGTVDDIFEGENVLGGEFTAPLIEASKIEVIDYMTAVAPTLQTIELNKTVEQHGLSITLEKIEFAKPHTRVYIKAVNNTGTDAYIDADNAKLVVGNKQYETDYFDTDYPELPYDLLAGIESEGILTFPALDPSTTNVQLVLEGHSDDYELDFTPYTFMQ